MKKLRILGVFTMLLIIINTTVFAATFRDVPNTHWAYAAISNIADRGLMVGDSQGYFKPNDFIDKFETAKILAKAAGYKYTNITAEEQAFYDSAYNKNKAYIQQYINAFKKWNSTSDREIAFLFERGILTPDDLNQFVIKDNSGTEQLRALSRQETAVFLVRLMGRTSEALAQNYTNKFADDASISSVSAPYVYYLRTINVISGDTDGKFVPNGAVNRASMAIMLDNCLKLMQTGTVPQPTPITQQPSNNTQVNVIDGFTGTVDKYFSELKALQVVLNTGERKIYKFTANASVTIDGYQRTPQDLLQGMNVVCVTSNGDIVDIKAQYGQAANNPQYPNINQNVAPGQTYKIEGIVSSISEQGGRAIAVEVRMLSPRDEITTEVRNFSLTNDCQVKRSEANIAFNTIVKGDVATLTVSGNSVMSIVVEEKNRRITNGILVDKKFVDATQTPVLSVTDDNGKRQEFRVSTGSYITRKDRGVTPWNELRIGDVIQLYAEYDIIKEMYATGVKSIEEGTVEEIKINRYGAAISLKVGDSANKDYNIIMNNVDVYSLRIGSKIRVSLDSREIEAVTVLSAPTNMTTTGYVQSVKAASIVIGINVNNVVTPKEVKIDANTVIMDSRTLARLTLTQLTQGMKLYVVYSSTTADTAMAVTVIYD